MKSTVTGVFDEKGFWRPEEGARFSPPFRKPFKGGSVPRFLFGWGGYLWPRNALLIGLSFFIWYVLQPSLEVTGSLAPGWILFILARNVALYWIIAGSYHLLLYTFKLKGTDKKYNPNWQEKNNKKYTFNNQVADNIFWSTVSGGIIWTAYEVLYWWAAGNGIAPLITFSENPGWFVGWFLIIPVIRESHFYFIHRLIHWKPLYRIAHRLHHRNTNPGPWSGLSMHPIEHIFYFSALLMHLVIPSHPVHFIFTSQHTGITPPHGHTGFEGPLLKGLLPAGDYVHYLHHRHVSSNFGTPTLPWDRWLGRFYNGIGRYPFTVSWAKKK